LAFERNSGRQGYLSLNRTNGEAKGRQGTSGDAFRIREPSSAGAVKSEEGTVLIKN